MRRARSYAVIAAVFWAGAAGAQFVQQGGKLSASDATGAPWQASTVAVSADGNTAIAGGYLDNGTTGAAWVYTRSAGVWSQQGAKLVGSKASGSAQQGWAVAISGDGNTAIVGGPADNSSNGAVWVFTRSGATWSQQGNKLVGGSASGHASQGWAVALSNDGNTAIVGGPGDNNGAGAVWVFTRSGGTWRQQGGKLVATGAAGTAGFGWAVALSGDGNTAVIGGPRDNNSTGAAWVFTNSAGKWSQQGAKLVGVKPDTRFTITGDASVSATFTQQPAPCLSFSLAVTPRSDDAIVTVGTQRNCNGGYLRGTQIALSVAPNTGFAFANWSGSGGAFSAGSSTLATTFTITANAKVTAAMLPQSAACQTLAVAANPAAAGTVTISTGETCTTGFTQGTPIVLIAQPATGWVFTGWSSATGAFSNSSTALTTFVIEGNTTVTANFAPPPTACHTLAISAGPAGAGSAAAVTAQNCSGGYVEGTRVSLSVTPTPGWVLSNWAGSGGTFSTTIGAVANGLQGSSVAVSADGSTVVVGGALDGYPPGAIWVFTRSGTTWLQQGNPLPVAAEAGVAHELWAVAISGDGNTVLAGEPGDDSGRGATWVFTRTAGVWAQQGGKLVGVGAAGNAEQGFAVALSADGQTAVVGGPNDAAGVGAAWVFAVGVAPACTLTLDPASQAFPAIGGRGEVAVTPGTSTCGWVAVADASWIVIGGVDAGTGPGTVDYAVSANTGATRSGTITVGGATLTVAQAGSGCTYALGPTSATFPEAGGSGAFTVTTTSACPWSATADAPWLHVAASGVVSGNGTVSFTADPNAGSARSAAIAVGDQTFTVTEAAHVPVPQASFSLTPASVVAGEVVQFSDLSAGSPATWSWSFGDGGTSTAQSPTHTFAAPGTYAVSLTVTNLTGSSTASESIPVGAGVATWLPVVSRSGGVAGSVWRSDVALLNAGGVPASVQGLFHGTSGVVVGNVVLPPGAQALVADVVGVLGAQGSGALEVLSDQPVVVSSRTYDVLAAGTVGQGYAAYGAGAGLGTGATAWLPGLVENAAYRTNISLTNMGADPAVVAVTLLDGSGTVLGSYDVTLEPGGWAQANQPFFAKAGQTAMANGYAEVTVTSGSGVIASASVIDKATGDPTTVTMVPAASMTGGTVWIPAVSHGSGAGGSEWRSDVALLNPGGVPASVQGLFHGASGVLVGNVVVPAGGEVAVADVVGQLGGEGSGALEVLSDQPVVAASRTYDVLAVGTVGQGYAAYGAGAGLGTGVTAWLPGLVENAAYRTNISLTNMGADPAVVAVTLLDGSGTVLGSYDVTLEPGGWAQANQPFLSKAGQTAMANGYAEVTVTSGSGVIASASVIDKATGDPTTVTMVPAAATP